MDRGEKRALWIAGAGHLALVGFLSVGILSTSRKLPPVDDVMPVDIVDIAAVPSTPRPVPRTAPEQGPDETPEETAEPEEQTPAPEPEPVPDPTPAPKPAPEKPKPAPEKPKPQKPAAKPAPKKPPQKSRLRKDWRGSEEHTTENPSVKRQR